MNRKLKAGLVSMGVGAALVTMPLSASAAVYDETYGCVDNGSGGADYNIGTCDGVWWHDNTLRRTLRLHFATVTHSKKTGYNNTPVDYVSKLDGDTVKLTFFCVNEKTPARWQVGNPLYLGGSNYSKSWSGGWNPCVGYGTGMQVVAQGGYGSVQDICTTVTVNTYYHQFGEEGYQETYPNHGKCTQQ